jgi:hypothetical protein
MLVEALTAVEQSWIATGLRQSVWLYPLVNAAHIAGLALLIGGIVPLDLKLLGAWPSVPLAILARVLVPAAICGLLLAMTTGALLFSVHATRYAGLGVFQLKMALVAAAAANAVLLERSLAWHDAKSSGNAGRSVRLAAGISLFLWTGVLLAGRLIAFVD